MPKHNDYKTRKLQDHMARTFHVVIERDEDGGYVGSVPELQGCYSQGDTIDELMVHIREAIELCLESDVEVADIVSVQKLEV